MSRKVVITKEYPKIEEIRPVILFAKFNEEIYDGYKVIKLGDGSFMTIPQKKFPAIKKEDLAKYEYTLVDETLNGEERIDVLENIIGKLLYHIRKTMNEY